jgi:cellulose synthase/poly-beta-1,6-N-acetylglucosamine synthase-like glycosyltransferase
MPIELLGLISLLYAIPILAFAIAASFARSKSDPMYRPTVSLVIAARNEESNIGRCLESVSRIDYPRDLFEAVIVNDRSTDRTAEIAMEYAANHPFIRVISSLPGTGALHGKANAVTQGIEQTTGEIIALTDADCIVQPGWIKEVAGHFSDPKVGVVAGFTYLRGNRLFEQMQALDWFGLFTVASGGVRLGIPITAVGTNLHVRRTAYEATGGFRKIPFSVTEDYALFHAVTKRTRFRARFPINPSMLVDSMPCADVEALYHQRKRWFMGGRGMALQYLIPFALAYIGLLVLIAGIPVMWTEGNWTPLLVKCGADLALLLPTIISYRKWGVLKAFPLYELYFYGYVLLLPPLVFFRRGIIWKDTHLRNRPDHGT